MTKYPLSILGTVVAIMLISFGAIILSKDNETRQMIFGLISIVAVPVILQLIGLARSEKNSEKIDLNTKITVAAAEEAHESKRVSELAKEEVKKNTEIAAKALAEKLAASEAKLMQKVEETLAKAREINHNINGNKQAKALERELDKRLDHIKETTDDTNRKVSE